MIKFHLKLMMMAVVLTALPLNAQTDDFADDAESAHNALIQAMTNIDPLTQQTVTAPPYGADGWMPIGEDYLLRFDGQKYPNSIYDMHEGSSHTINSGYSLIKENRLATRCTSPLWSRCSSDATTDASWSQ